jgi:2-C-methyl-D-erythritol 2,4-cyclodiphosphate synthase
MRIGHGYDVHRFGGDRPLTLGGVRIPHDRGVLAHSDGDVVIHALCDALLGALALGDIGRHFPDTDKSYAGMDSRRFLERVNVLVKGKGYRLGNADITVLAQAPKLAPHIESMRTTLAETLAVDTECINVKATTTEGMGFTGRGEGIAAHAVVILLPDPGM